jgi:CBS domain-containing protein
VGLISLGELRSALFEEGLNRIVLARDIAVPVGRLVYQQQPLKEALDMFERREVDYLPVVRDENSKEVVGILEYRPLIESVNRKLLERQQSLD